MKQLHQTDKDSWPRENRLNCIYHQGYFNNHLYQISKKANYGHRL
jgi:hypothetical protein